MAQFKLAQIHHGNKTMGANHGNTITFGKAVSSSHTPNPPDLAESWNGPKNAGTVQDHFLLVLSFGSFYA